MVDGAKDVMAVEKASKKELTNPTFDSSYVTTPSLLICNDFCNMGRTFKGSKVSYMRPFVKLIVLMFPSEMLLIAVNASNVDGMSGKLSGVHGLLGSANKICPDERFTYGAIYGPDIPLLLSIMKTSAEKKLTGKYTT